MQDTKKMEVKCIHVWAVFKFCGGIFFIAGLLIGLFGGMLNINVVSVDIIRIFPFTAKLSPGIPVGILFGMLYGVSAGIGSSVFALLYNFFAAIFGGITFGVKE